MVSCHRGALEVLLSLGSSVLDAHETPRKKESPKGPLSPRVERPKVDLALIEQAVSSLPAIKEAAPAGVP